MVKNITMSAEDLLIARARKKARKDQGNAYRDLMTRLSYIRPGKRLTRDERNER